MTGDALQTPASHSRWSVPRVVACFVGLFALAGVVRLFTLITFVRGNPFAVAHLWRTPDPVVLLLSSLLALAAGAFSAATERSSRLGMAVFILHVLLATYTAALIIRVMRVLYLTGGITPQPF
jgi:uncharacterized membrane protein YsdA (DUF1294 family)